MAKLPVSWRAEELGLAGKSHCPLLATVQASGPKYAPVQTERRQLALPSELAKGSDSGSFRLGLRRRCHATTRSRADYVQVFGRSHQRSANSLARSARSFGNSPTRLASHRSSHSYFYSRTLNADNEDSVSLGRGVNQIRGSAMGRCPEIAEQLLFSNRAGRPTSKDQFARQ